MGPYEGMMVRRKDPKVIETNNNGKIENMWEDIQAVIGKMEKKKELIG